MREFARSRDGPSRWCVPLHAYDCGEEALEPDTARLYFEMRSRMRRLTSRRKYGNDLVDAVCRRFRSALLDDGPGTREERWREFLIAVKTFLLMERLPESADLGVLETILRENADLLPTLQGVAVGI